MKIRIIHLVVILSTIALFSCTKQDRENTIINQESAIDSYISSLGDVAVVRNGGSNRVILDAGNGTDAAIGDSLYIRYAGYIFSRGKGSLFATNDSTSAKQGGYPVQQAPMKIKLGSTDMVSGLAMGLDGVKEGEHCYIIFSAKYGFNNIVVYNIPKLSPLFFEIWVDKVVK